MRALDWSTRPPPLTELLDLVNAALFDGTLDGNARPSIERDRGALRLHVFHAPVRATHYDAVVIEFPLRGHVRVRRNPTD